MRQSLGLANPRGGTEMATLAFAPSSGWSGEDRHAATDLFSPYMVQTLADCAAIGNVELEQWPWVATSAATRHSRTRPSPASSEGCGVRTGSAFRLRLARNASPRFIRTSSSPFRQTLPGGLGEIDDSSFGVIGLRRGYRIACAHSDPADVRCRGHQTLLSRLPRVPARLAGR